MPWTIKGRNTPNAETGRLQRKANCQAGLGALIEDYANAHCEHVCNDGDDLRPVRQSVLYILLGSIALNMNVAILVDFSTATQINLHTMACVSPLLRSQDW